MGQEELLGDPGQGPAGAWPQGIPQHDRLERQPGLHAQQGPPSWQVGPQGCRASLGSVNRSKANQGWQGHKGKIQVTFLSPLTYVPLGHEAWLFGQVLG